MALRIFRQLADLLDTAFSGVANDDFVQRKAGAWTNRTVAQVKTDLNVIIGTDVQAYNASLAAIAAGTWTGASSITTLGTITTGTWSASTIGVAYGGTGATSLPANNVILGNGTSAVQTVAPGTSGNVLTSNGTTWESATASGASSPIPLLNAIWG